jgi:hypothetical protein
VKERKPSHKYSNGPGAGGIWNSKGIRRRRPRRSYPHPLMSYGKRLLGLDYGVKDTVTNSFEPDKTVPPPKGGYPKNKTATQKITTTATNSRRG